MDGELRRPVAARPARHPRRAARDDAAPRISRARLDRQRDPQPRRLPDRHARVDDRLAQPRQLPPAQRRPGEPRLRDRRRRHAAWCSRWRARSPGRWPRLCDRERRCPRATRSTMRRDASARCSQDRVPEQILTPHPRHQADRWPERLAGRAVRAVDAHGKHLFVRFDGDLTLHSHLRMTGAWGVHREGARWKRARRRAWLVLRAGEWNVVQFDGPLLELMRESRTRFDRRLAALGQDVIGASFDAEELSAPAARRRPGAGDRRRAARPADRRGHRQRVEVRGMLRRGAQPLATARSPARRGGRRGRAVRARAHARVGRRRRLQLAPARRLQARRNALRALRHADPPARTGRRQPPDLLVPGLSALTPAPGPPHTSAASLRPRPCAAIARCWPRRSPAGRGCARRRSPGGSPP